MPIQAHIECRFPEGNLYISEAVSKTPESLLVGATAIHDILTDNWQRYVDEGIISRAALTAKIRQPDEQAARMAATSQKEARYFFVQDMPIMGSPDQVQGFARIEMYNPRLLGRSYPNISDLEMRGDLGEPAVSTSAQALLFHALSSYKPSRRVAAYVECPNRETQQFFVGAGFYERRTTEPELIAEGSWMSYVHLQADSVQKVATGIVPAHSFVHI